ncbi:shikimate kinase [Desulfovibrio aerotolerans]|uniref:Shikimate kinase n=1 Tax=Solidesulfovibrio aerotolerans TaxID=295255 RepID=A0A7C9ILY9_9BACT|nr:shikimate kinase [Solidesulfovibrio aerotolerans]MYL83644.1 shikimate kinase [Solidesulfovibrio aerotolerans]
MEPTLLDRLSHERCVSLIGMAGAGKSTLATLLARRLGWACLDTDRLIEAHCRARLPDILARHGLPGFLAIEDEVVAGLGVRRCVVATGGSVIYGPRAVARLKAMGPVVYLAVDLATFLARVGDPGERAFVMPGGMTLSDVYAERQPLYAAAADLTVATCGVTPAATVEHLLQGIKL